MKKHERRAANAYPYYKLATYDSRSMTWRDGRAAFRSEEEALREAQRSPGRYRLSRVESGGRHDLEAFDVASGGQERNCFFCGRPIHPDDAVRKLIHREWCDDIQQLNHSTREYHGGCYRAALRREERLHS